MEKEQLKEEAYRFRQAIEKARDKGEFDFLKLCREDRMRHFPKECCDDSADLFTHYIYSKYEVDSIRVDGEYYDSNLKITRGHSWQVIDGWIIDLTGDQFDKDEAVRIKTLPVYVGEKDRFHEQFAIYSERHSKGIDSLSSECHKRMKELYSIIMKYME